MPTKPSTDIIPFQSYALAKHDTSELLDTIRENVGGGAITPFDLERVKIPTGGGIAWEIPTLEGDPEVMRNLDGVIVYHREPRAFWRKSFVESTGSEPPDCSSQFGDIGIGDPGGECASCQYAQWGSKPLLPGQTESRGQWCRQIKLTFLLREETLLPLALFLPPTSLVNIRKYLLGLASRGQHYSSVLTRFTLESVKGEGSIEYSVARPTRLAILDEAEAARVREYSQAIRSVLDTVTITEADVAEGPTDVPLPDPEVADAAERLGATVEGEEPF